MFHVRRAHYRREVRNSVHSAAMQMLIRSVYQSALALHQVYRAVRSGVQDSAVKLLANVDAAQLATFSQVIRTHTLCSALLMLC